MLASPKTLLYQEIADRLATLIRQGTYPPGARIPSVRQTSEQQGVSISTVLQAYSLLESRGLIEARPQSGYYVRRQTSDEPARAGDVGSGSRSDPGQHPRTDDDAAGRFAESGACPAGGGACPIRS